MRVIAFAVVSLMMGSGVAIAQQKSGHEAALLAIEEKWDAASVKGDTAALGAIWADTFISTTPEGKVHTKAEMLIQIKSGSIKYQLAKVDDMKVVVYKVVVCCLWRRCRGDREMEGQVRGEWQECRHHGAVHRHLRSAKWAVAVRGLARLDSQVAALPTEENSTKVLKLESAR